MLIEINNWTRFYKYSEDGIGGRMSQQTYEPLISPDGKIFCANYDWQNEYQRTWQPNRIGYTQDVVEYFFDKEVEYANRFSNKQWAPEIIDVDNVNKRIYYKWYGPTCNELIYTGQPLPSNWKLQLQNIMMDAYREGVYKLTMYPHCHYYDNNGIMHCIDLYGCVEVEDPFIEAKYMDGIIHETAQFRLDETGELVNGKYNLGTMFKQSLVTHVKWGEDNMSFIYKEMFNA
jgi:hypothetical protein